MRTIVPRNTNSAAPTNESRLPIGSTFSAKMNAVMTAIAPTFIIPNGKRMTNSNAVIQRNRRVTSATFDQIQENLSPRAFRLGVKYSF